MAKAKQTSSPASESNVDCAGESGEVRITKLDRLIEALKAPGGADISTMMAVTGWQSHSVRGALAGTLKKRKGLTIESEKRDGIRYYRIEDVAVR